MSGKTKKTPEYYYFQSGVIPYIYKDKQIKIVLIRSRKNKKWIIPKGIIEKGMSSVASAAKEAREEAGVRGKIFKDEIIRYNHKKWNGTCKIKIYLMKVSKILPHWEEDFRRRILLSPEKAAEKIGVKPLKSIIRDILSQIQERE